MVEVPTKQEFDALKAAVDRLVAENDFLRSIIMAQRALTRRQVLKALDISESTLWRLSKNGKLHIYTEKGKTYYGLDSIREYLTGIKKIEKQRADQRIIEAIYVFAR